MPAKGNEMPASGWPPFDDRNLPDDERRLMRDMALRRLVDRAIEAEHMHIFESSDVDALKALARWYRAATLLGGLSKWSMPVIAFIVALLAGWDKLMEAARAIASIFR